MKSAARSKSQPSWTCFFTVPESEVKEKQYVWLCGCVVVWLCGVTVCLCPTGKMPQFVFPDGKGEEDSYILSYFY